MFKFSAYPLADKEPLKIWAWVENDDSADILKGRPAVFNMDGTDDGIDVINPSAAATDTTLLAGIAAEDIKQGQANLVKNRGWVQIYGFHEGIKVVRQTRAASTDSYQSFPAIAKGDRFNVESTPNAVSRSDAGAEAVLFAGIVAAESLASGASSASNTSDTSTAVESTMKAFLRLM